MNKTLTKLALTFLVLPLVFLTSGVLKPQVAHAGVLKPQVAYADTTNLVIIIPRPHVQEDCKDGQDSTLSDNEQVFLSILVTCTIVFFIVDFIRQSKR